MYKKLNNPLVISILALLCISCSQSEVTPNKDLSNQKSGERLASNQAEQQVSQSANQSNDQSSLDVVEQHYGKAKIKGIPAKTSLAEINQLLGLNCESSQQCKVIGVGASPCGGFAGYLVYSNSDTNESKLKSQVANFNGMQKLKNKSQGTVGICQHIEPPKTQCVANQCVAALGGRSQL